MANRRYRALPRRSLADDIADRIRQMIAEGQLRANEQLPPERELAAILGVSRPSLREALRILAQQNIVSRHHGRGTYVTSLEPAILLDIVDTALLIRSVSLDQAMEARRVVEVDLAGLATQRAEESELQGLAALLDDLEEPPADPEAVIEVARRFQSLLAAAAHNPLLSRIADTAVILSHRAFQPASRLAAAKLAAQPQRRALVQALLSRDAGGARAAMGAYLDALTEVSSPPAGNDRAREHGSEEDR